MSIERRRKLDQRQCPCIRDRASKHRQREESDSVEGQEIGFFLDAKDEDIVIVIVRRVERKGNNRI